jgi:hypothetical protein
MVIVRNFRYDPVALLAVMAWQLHHRLRPPYFLQLLRKGPKQPLSLRHINALEKLRARSSRSSPCVGLTSLLHRLSSVPGVSARRLYASIHAVVPRYRPAALLFVGQDWFEAEREILFLAL